MKLNRFFVLVVLAAGLCLVASSSGCSRGGGSITSHIVLRSPMPDSNWALGGELVIDGTYLVNGVPAPSGTEIMISVFYDDGNMAASCYWDPAFAVSDGGKFNVVILIKGGPWEAGRHMVQIVDDDTELFFVSDKFNIIE